MSQNKISLIENLVTIFGSGFLSRKMNGVAMVFVEQKLGAKYAFSAKRLL